MDESDEVRTFVEHQIRKPKHKEALDSIVQVFCVYANQSSSTSTGFIIGAEKVLTNAHFLDNHSQLFLKKIDSNDMYVAQVLAIGNECDLALLTVDDEEFWKGVSPVEFGSLPTLGDSVTVVGYPKNRNSACVTGAFVSCIDVLPYAPGGSTKLLCLQIQVDINLQNSGAPAFNDKGECVGVSLLSLKVDYSDKLCYLVPAPVVLHFIQDYEKSKEYTGFPVLGFEWQEMQNAGFRKIMGMTARHKGEGIMVTRVDPTSPAAQYLQQHDIILKVDGVRIGCDGTVPFKLGGLISLSYLVTQKYTGDTVVFEVLRDSKLHKFKIKLGSDRSNVIRFT